MGIEEEAQPRREIVDFESPAQGPFHVLHPIVEGESQFLQRCRTRLPNVIAADGNGVEAWSEERRELDGVDHQPHRRRRREDEFLLRDIFLQDVILQRARSFFPSSSLLLDRHQVHGPQHVGGRVDGHGNAGLVQLDAGEENLHVFQRIDSHPAFAHLSFALRGVGVVSHQGRQVKGYGQPSAAVSQQVAVARVGLFRRGKAGELAHGPEFAAVPGAMDAARIRRLAGKPKRPVRRQIGRSIELPNRHARDAGKSSLFGVVSVPHGPTPTDQHSKQTRRTKLPYVA